MSSDSTTPVDITPAADILQAINPHVLATLLALRDRDQKTQAEIASEVGCARSTISKYVQTLSSLPIDVLDKDGHNVTVTTTGHTLIDLYRTALAERDIDIETVDWDTDDAETVDQALSPLFRFRSPSPYLILDGIYELDSQASESPELWEDDLLMEIDSRNPTTIDSISSQHFDQILDKFDTHDIIDRHDQALSLTPKGRTLGALCRQLQLTFGDTHTDDTPQHEPQDSSTDEELTIGGAHPDSPTPDPQQQSPTGTPNIQSTASSGILASPDSANSFRGGLPRHGVEDTARLGPVICIETPDTIEPVGLVEGDTPTALASQLRTLASKIETLDTQADAEPRVRVYRSLVRGESITPLGDDWQNLSEASHNEWQIINKALQLVSNEP